MVSKVNGGSSGLTVPTGQDSNTATVREGDTLSSVASRHNVSDKQLLESNPQIKDSKNLSPGMELNLPEPIPAGRKGAATSPGNVAASAKAAAAPATSQSTIPAGRTSTASAATLQSGSSGSQVKKLQNDVNQWRAQNGQPAISEAGKFNTETKDAVTDFQRTNALKEDGVAGIPTQSRLELENNANFKQLTDPTKTLVRNQMTSYGSDAQKLQNTSQLATSAGFGQLSEDHQKQMLEGLNKRPSDQNLSGELTAFGNSPTFRGLPDADKTNLIRNVSNTGSAVSYVGNLSNDQLLTLAESPTGQNQLTALGEAIQSGGVNRAEKPQLDRIGVGTFTPGAGVALNGSAADQATFLHMTRREMLVSPSFNTLMNTQNADAAHPVTINVAAAPHPMFVDAFHLGGTQDIALNDLQQFPENPPAANPNAMTRGENLVHSMAEARQGALGNVYMDSHTRAIQAENQYRVDIGQKSRLKMPPNDLTMDAAGNATFHFNNGYAEEIRIVADDITAIVPHNP
ncbi:LysM peptidoglycan-binding domain-containing protein [bacterium]|nr:LysM peptidoglycan-binding domain-containing protein [bacterium]